MSNRSDKARQDELRQREAAAAAESARDRAAAREPGAVETPMQKQSLDWFNVLNDPNRNFAQHAGVTALMEQEGEAGADEERAALGAARFGAAGADPNLQHVLARQMKERKSQRRGRALASAVSRYDTIMRAQAGDLVSQENARRMGSAGLSTNLAANAAQNYAAFQPRPHWGLTLAAAGIGAAGSALSGRL